MTEHVIAGLEQRTTPEGATVYRWKCACGDHGKWTTLRHANASGPRHARKR